MKPISYMIMKYMPEYMQLWAYTMSGYGNMTLQTYVSHGHRCNVSKLD